MTYQEFQKRYQYHPVNDRIGKGGFGVVYKAYDTHLDRYVAIKMSEVDDFDSPTRLAREVELASKLPTHTNIAHYEMCYTFNTPVGTFDFGILQYYKSGNLSDLIKSGTLTTADKISILKQILNGIRFLHKNKIIHRDLKPRNILIALRGNKYIPKITDFGISKKFDADNSSSLGNSMVGAGTLTYSSPEQLSERKIHRNTDLWSYGIIAYQLFTGKRPFNTGQFSSSSHEGRIEFFRQINSGLFPDEINTIPAPWQGAIRRLLIADPERRFKNCKEVKEFITTFEKTDKRNENESDKIADDITTPDKNKTLNEEVIEKPYPQEDDIQDNLPLIEEKGKNSQFNNEDEKEDEELGDFDNGSWDDDEDNNLFKKPMFWIALTSLAIVAASIFYYIWHNKTSFNKTKQLSIIEQREDSSITNYDYKLFISDIEIQMRLIPGGTYTMGSKVSKGHKDEKPAHIVTLDTFFMSATEITQAQWTAVMGTTIEELAQPFGGRLYGIGENYPIYYISWEDATAFCDTLSKYTGKEYRLPTEAEWEYAARGGETQSTKYSGSNNINEVAWYRDNSNKTAIVANKVANRFGLYDMSGNIYEWCFDWYSNYKKEKQRNPMGPTSGEYKVLRGGCFEYMELYQEITNRTKAPATTRNHCNGFRIVCTGRSIETTQ